MAAAEGFSFLDSTLSGFAEDPRLPASLRADETPVFAQDRVVPLLLHDIVSSMQVRQRLHLRLLAEQLDDLIEFDDTTQEEYEMLLVMLFSFTHRRSGLTPLQKRHNVESSDLAFTILHALVGRLHAKSALVMRALAAVCTTLGCALKDDDAATGGAGDEAELLPAYDEYANVVDTVAGALPAAESDIEICAKELASLERSAAGSLVAAGGAAATKQPQDKLFVHAPLYAYSIDALPAQDRVGISEYEFTCAVGAFDSLPKLGGDDDDASGGAAIDRRNFSVYLTSGGFFGPRYISADQAGKVRHTVEGGVVLFDVIKFLFPLVPEGVLLKRIHGMILVAQPIPESARGAVSGDATPSPPPSARAAPLATCTPPTLIQDIQQSPRMRYGHQLSLWHIAGEPKTQRADALQWLVRWFADADYCHSGLLSVDGLNAPGIVQNPWEEHVRTTASKRRKTRVSVYDVLHQVFPPDTFEVLKEPFTLALRTAEKDFSAAVKYKQVANTTYKLALVRFVELQEGGVNPGGDNTTAMSSGEQRALAAFASAQRDELNVYLHAALQLSKAKHHRDVLAARQHEAQQAQLEVLNHSRLALVEATAGPAAPPPVCDIAGFRVNRTILELDGFLSDAGSRARAQTIMQACDFAGIPAGLFLERPSEAHLHVRRGASFLCASHGVVYRDFTFSSARPPTGSHWDGDHKLRIVTNIRKGSDVKYRFSFEGYNFGINKAIATTVVGHASTSLTNVGSLESFGWPDGWDRSSVLHYNNGFEALHQRYNDDGYVVMDVEAHSFSKVGFGVSVWLCMPDHGKDFDVTVHVEHL